MGGGKCDYQALVNINGKDLKLQKIESKTESGTERFKADGTELEVDYGQTICADGGDTCDSYHETHINCLSGPKRKANKRDWGMWGLKGKKKEDSFIRPALTS